MTIKELATLAGISPQAVYKRLKTNGINLAEIRDQDTGRFTEAGEQRMRELFSINTSAHLQEASDGPVFAAEAVEAPSVEEQSREELEALKAQAEGLRNQIEELTTEVARLSTEVEVLRVSESAMRSERDFLRGALENSQKLQALTASKIPNPPAALMPADPQGAAPVDTDSETGARAPEKGSRLQEWWRRVRGHGGR